MTLLFFKVFDEIVFVLWLQRKWWQLRQRNLFRGCHIIHHLRYIRCLINRWKLRLPICTKELNLILPHGIVDQELRERSGILDANVHYSWSVGIIALLINHWILTHIRFLFHLSLHLNHKKIISLDVGFFKVWIICFFNFSSDLLFLYAATCYPQILFVYLPECFFTLL